jgi:hypothetical protein
MLGALTLHLSGRVSPDRRVRKRERQPRMVERQMNVVRALDFMRDTL